MVNEIAELLDAHGWLIVPGHYLKTTRQREGIYHLQTPFAIQQALGLRGLFVPEREIEQAQQIARGQK